MLAKENSRQFWRIQATVNFLRSTAVMQPDANEHCRTGVISFVEPKNGSVVEESFTISDKELADLQTNN